MLDKTQMQAYRQRGKQTSKRQEKVEDNQNTYPISSPSRGGKSYFSLAIGIYIMLTT
jgi:hypothetical protein